MQGGEALEHKVLEGEGGPKLVNLIGWCIEVQKNLEWSVGGTQVGGDNLEAYDQWQSKSVGKDVVPAHGLGGPGSLPSHA